jgi:peptidoglycan/xylan/chitin deacetylase (PgdA/CDA1 family)
MGFLSVSVDLDEIDCYHAIHGIPDAPKGDAVKAVYDRALPRISRFFEDNEIQGTLFVVGKDLAEPASARAIGAFGRAGCEIANHTQSHLYDFSALSTDDQSREIEDAGHAIAKACGVFPKGFRAPGYTMNLGIVSLLIEQGYEYDSSVFPCPAYYAAKACIIGARQLMGRASKSVLGDPRVLTASSRPYRIGDEGIWSRGDSTGLKELPIATVTAARLPFIGTSVGAAGVLGAKVLAKAAACLPVVNFELHGMDFLDAEKDGLSYLAAYQTDLRISLDRRLSALSAAVKVLLDKGLEPVPLRAAAARAFV